MNAEIEIIAEPEPHSRLTQAEALRDRFLHSYRDGSKTQVAYARDLASWYGYCAKTNIDPMRAKRPHVEDWVRKVETTEIRTSRGNHPTGRFPKPATVHRMVNTVRTLYAYAIENEILDRSPVPSSRQLSLKPRPTTSPTRSLTQAEAIRFLDAARARGPRDAAMAAVMLYQGIRVGGLCELNVESLSTRSEGRTLIVHLKGGDYQEQLLADTTAECIDTWLATRANPDASTEILRREPVADSDGTPLFTDRNGKRIAYWHAEHVVRVCAKAAKVEKKLSPHSLRHTCITEALNANVPLADVQTMAGHKNADTTVGYDRARTALSRSPVHKLNGWFG